MKTVPINDYADDMPESHFFALPWVVFMMGFVYIFDKMHWRHKYGWLAANLMTQVESHRLFRIRAASQNEGDEDYELHFEPPD